MPTLTKPTHATIMEDGGATMMARILGADAAAIAQADFGNISVRIYDQNASDPSATVATATLTVATVVFDAYQTDARWSVDSTGYNFADVRPAASFPTGGHTYDVEYEFDPTAGDNYFVTFSLFAQPVRTS